ncbi:MAG: DUF503 domain-containing protein [Trueperaceae bacterium]
MRASGAVYVGVLTVTLEFPGVRSLKEKRAQVKPLTERLKTRFAVTVARLDGLDAHDWERVGVATISADRDWVERTLASALSFVIARGLAVRESDISVERWDEATFDD